MERTCENCRYNMHNQRCVPCKRLGKETKEDFWEPNREAMQARIDELEKVNVAQHNALHIANRRLGILEDLYFELQHHWHKDKDLRDMLSETRVFLAKLKNDIDRNKDKQ